MKIGLTYNTKKDWSRRAGDPVDADAELDKPEAIDFIEKALAEGGHEVVRIGSGQKLLDCLDRISVDIVFNICEGFHGRNRESEVPNILEMHNIPFVGADALTLGMTLDKVIAKKIFTADGIPTPRFFSARQSDDLESLNTIGFPLIVKTRHEGTSKGLTDQSRVTNVDELRRQVALINETYGQPALVEEFISGTEFTVPVIGNRFPEAQAVIQVSMDGSVDLGDKMYTFERVQDDSNLRYICPAKVSGELEKKLKELAVTAYRSVECRDMGRVDFRVDKKRRPFVLEINPLPSLAHNDVFNLFPQIKGVSYADVINQILNCALERYGLINGSGEKRSRRLSEARS